MKDYSDHSIGYRLQDRFDFLIFIPVVVLSIIGLIAIFSSTYNHPTVSGNFQKQAVWFVFSIGVLLTIYLIPLKTFRLFSGTIYIFSIILLLLVIFFGKKIYGAQSWLNFGPIGFQPSEFAKIGLILFLSQWITNSKRDINDLKDLIASIAIGIIPVMLILLQPDMGTAIVFVVITASMIFWSGINLFGIFIVLSPGIVTFASLFGTIPLIIAIIFVIGALFYFKRDLFTNATVFVVNIASAFLFDYAYKFLQPHQQKRIEAFLDPSSDPLGSGYNALQAKVAIGSGGLLGKGFMEGNQTQLRYIPEQWTDFIYCVIGEEFGFIGSILTIALFIILFYQLLNLASTSKDNFSSLVVIGILSLYFTHFLINIGMNLGITPVIGLPLPFVSYGGSSLMVNMILLGIALNIYRHRKEYS